MKSIDLGFFCLTETDYITMFQSLKGRHDIPASFFDDKTFRYKLNHLKQFPKIPVEFNLNSEHEYLMRLGISTPYLDKVKRRLKNYFVSIRDDKTIFLTVRKVSSKYLLVLNYN